MDPESNHTSRTSSMRRMVLVPVGSSGFGRVSSSMNGRCRSTSPSVLRGRRPKSRSRSASDPYASTRGCSGSSLFQIGIGRSPVPVAADRPVARALEPFAELTVLDVLGHPGDLLVVREHAVLELGDAHEPARDGLVDQRVAAAPAVRVRVLVARQAQQAPVLRAAGGRAGCSRPSTARPRRRSPAAGSVRRRRGTGSSGMPAAPVTRWSSSP